MQYVLFCIVVFLTGYVIYALTHNDGNVFCDPTECATCPFPHDGCKHRKELFYYDLIRMDGQHIYVEIDQRLIPVRVRYENNLLWFVSSMGSVTSYDDIEKAGGKFFKKFSKTS